MQVSAGRVTRVAPVRFRCLTRQVTCPSSRVSRRLVVRASRSHVRSDVGQDRRASARWLAVGHPVVVPDLGRHGRAEASGAYGCAARTPQEPREGPHGHEPGSTAG